MTLWEKCEAIRAWVKAINGLGVSTHAANDAFYELCRVLNTATLEEWAAAFGQDESDQ